MNVFEISTRPPNSYLFSSTSNSHLNGPSSTASPQFDLNYPNNHHQSFNNNSCQNHAPNHCQYHQTNHNSHNFHQHHPSCQHHPQYSQYSNYAASSSSTPNHNHQSRRTAATNISFNSGHLSRNESPHVAATSFNLKQRSSSTNSQMPSNNTRNNNLVTTAHIRYNGNTNQYNGGNLADVVTSNNGVSLKSFGGPSGGSSRVLPVTTTTSNSSSSNAGNCSTPSSPHLSSWTNGSRPVTNLNRSMSGKFVARVIATNNTTPPSTTSSASTQTTNQVPSNCLYHRVESPSPRAAARVHSNYSNLPQSYPNHNHNQRAMAHNNDYITSSAVPIQTTSSATLNETNSSGGGAGNSTLATATVLPVYYEKDSVVTSSAQLPVLKIPQLSRASSTLISNSANSGVGSATAVITVNNPHSAAAAHNAASLSSHPTMSSSSFFDHKNNNISNANLKSALQQPSALTNNSVPIANRFNRGSSSNSSATSYQRSNGAAAAGVTFYSDDINTNNNKISNKSYSVIKGIKVNDPSATIAQPQQSQSVPKTSILNNGSFRLSKQQQENSNNKDINNSNNNSNQPVDTTSNNNAAAPQSASKKFTSSFNQFLNSNRLMSQLMQKSSSSASSSSSSSSSSSNDQQQNGNTNNNNSNTGGSQQTAQKSILVNRKKFAYPTQTGVGNMTMIGSGADGSSSPPPPYAPPKKTVTFAN